MEGPTNKTPGEVLDIMLTRDQFTRWLGLQIDEIREGYCRLHFVTREEMLNGFNIVHGGVLFAACDSAFAFACNSHGRVTVALDVSITFMRPAGVGEKLTVEAKQIHLGNKVGVYDIRTTNELDNLVAHFKGTAYRTSKSVE
jgi:acyl-CoA thioesterase